MVVAQGRDKGKILVADDSSLARGWIVGCLTLAGYDVISSSDGEEALAKATTEAPELIFLDAIMPKLSGPEVWGRLKQDPETAPIPVVIMIPRDYGIPGLMDGHGGYDALIYKPVSRDEILARTRSLLKSSRIFRQTSSVARVLDGLGSILEARDIQTKEHSERVGEYAFKLGMRLGLPPKQSESLRRGAFLHDVGKVGIEDAILFKSGPLSEDEYEKIRSHPHIGARILNGFGGGLIAREAILHHHERWDGTGYPDNLKGEAIPLAARILAVADSYDALVSKRPYRKARTPKEAAVILREGRGKRYDPMVVDSFLEMVGHRRDKTEGEDPAIFVENRTVTL